MQSIQNLGLAVVTIITGVIVDHCGYLVLEVFFLFCLFIALIAGGGYSMKIIKSFNTKFFFPLEATFSIHVFNTIPLISV